MRFFEQAKLWIETRVRLAFGFLNLELRNVPTTITVPTMTMNDDERGWWMVDVHNVTHKRKTTMAKGEYRPYKLGPRALLLVLLVAPCWWSSCTKAHAFFLLHNTEINIKHQQKSRHDFVHIDDDNYFSSQRHAHQQQQQQQQQQNPALLSSSRKDFIAKTAALLLLLQYPKAACATIQDPKTGILLPSEGEIEDAVPKDWSNVDNPFVDDQKSSSSSSNNNLFSRLDSSPDSVFYTNPRFVEHIDENAVQLLTDYVSNQASTAGATESVLDLCSSWTSHITVSCAKDLKRIVGVGMNQQELEANPVLTEWLVQDLNQDPKLPFPDDCIDVVLCQLSIDYLTRPLQVLKEAHRVLRPGGTIHILFSNRLFLTKAVALWTGADDIDHAYTVACYLHFCCAADASKPEGCFENIQAIDLSRRTQRGSSGERRIIGDPLYVVKGMKSKTPTAN
jgi:SAM-dependent methyltransferase